MHHRLFLVAAAAALLTLTLPTLAQQDKPKRDTPMAPVTDDPKLPRVLLIGDSISIGYTVPVRALLKGKANVHRPRTNCGPTTRGLAQIDAWLETGGKDKKWDVIHFNWGLHDLKYINDKGGLVDVDKGKQQVPIDQYEANLRKLVKRLKKTGATLIWCSTTPVPKGAKGRVVGDSVKYNAAAARVMKAEGVATNDLYTFAYERQDKIMRKANVHFTPEGSKVLGKRVVEVISPNLPKQE